jgi:hypothetical protein
LVECNPDEYILTAMGVPRSRIRHEDGKPEILRKLERGKAMIALVDQDPNSNQLKVMEKYIVTEENEDSVLLVHSSGKGTIIQVKPYLEEWILKRAKVHSIDPRDYKLPRDGRGLHDIKHVEKRQAFRDMIEELVKNDLEFKKIREWIENNQ